MISINFTDNTRLRRKIYGIAGALLTLAIPYIIMLHGKGHIEAEQSLCPFKMITGFPCPGCGITKSLVFLYKGDLLKSVSFHLFGPAAFLFCILTVLVLSLEILTQKEFFRSILYSKKLAYTLGTILVIYHFTRLIVFVSTNNIDSIIQESIWK